MNNLSHRDAKTLETLYWERGLSSVKIAKMLGTSDSPILYWMRKFNIPRRPPKRKVPEKYNIPKELLEKLYLKKGLTIKQIAIKLGVNCETVRLRLLKHEIPIRKHPKEKYKITKEQLEDLYLKKKLSTNQITKKLGVSDRKTIWSRMVKFNIPRRTISEATTKYHKKPFIGDLKEKAYMIGLRIGDFSADKRFKVVRIMSSTTKPNQLKMFRDVFGKYGHAHYFIHKRSGWKEWSMYCHLHDSFDFLIKKLEMLPKWIIENDEVFYSFLAGYSDAEGCWVMIKDGKDAIRFTFCIATCDKIILQQIRDKLEDLGFKAYLRLMKKKGERNKLRVHKKDYFIVVMNRKKEIVSLAKKMLLLSHHEDKINKMKIIIKNENKRWSEIEKS